MYWSKNSADRQCYTEKGVTLCCGFKEEFKFLNMLVIFQKFVKVETRRFCTWPLNCYATLTFPNLFISVQR